VTGRKLWRIYGETRRHPVTGDKAPRPEKVDEPLWEAMLEDGDLLYIPRGWWHVALPVAEPTLHLTVGIHKRTGLDLLRWLEDGLSESESVRQDLPRFASQDARNAHIERLRAEVIKALNDDSLNRFLQEYDEAAMPRAHLSLPWSATADVLPPGDEARVRFLAPRPLDIEVEGKVAEFSCLKKHWRFAAEAALVLQPLMERRTCSVAELVVAAEGTLDRERVRRFLTELISHGLICMVED
jgi:hypothetical protein